MKTGTSMSTLGMSEIRATSMCLFSGLSSYWKYKFEIYTNTIKGVSTTVGGPEVVTDESAAPSAVENLVHQPVNGVYIQYQLSWRCPAQKDGRNGIIRRATVITSSFVDDVNPKIREHHFDNSDCTWSEQIPVTPEFNYTFEVFISNSQKGESTTIQQYMPAGPPSIRTSERSVIDVVRGTETEESVELLTCPTCLLDNTIGVIVKSGILVCAKGECPIRNVKEVKTAEDYDELPNWDTSSSVNFKTWYRATGDDWLEGKEASDEIRFVLGGERCGSQDQSRFCNGPLPVDRTYRVWLFACTRVACSEGKYAEFTLVVKDASLPLPIIGAIVGASVLLVLAVVLLVLYIKVIRPRSQRQRSTKYVSDTSPKDDTYAEIGDGLGVVNDDKKVSTPSSEDTYDQLKVYSNHGQNDYEKIEFKN